MTKQRKQNLLRKQLDQRFQRERGNFSQPPSEGWIRTIREGLGMSLTQLAKKLGVTRQGMRQIEVSEKKGTLTLSTLKKIADALNCEMRVSLIPRESLETMVHNRARARAKEIVQRTHLQMSLENQGTDSEFQEGQVEEIAKDLIRNPGRRLWEDF